MKNSHTSLIITAGSICTLVAIILVGGYRFMESGDFWLQAKVSCSSEKESCFVEETESGVDEFKIIHIKKYATPHCNEWDAEGCQELSCNGLPPEACKEYACSEKNIQYLGIELACRQKHQ
jgi:hypothetical protein